MNSREAAFLALFSSLKGERYIAESLSVWQRQHNPPPQDYHLARQIAYGSAQMALALDYLAAQTSDKKKMSLKLKEKALLRTALYQIHFLSRIPPYAVVDESMKIAKKYFHHFFTRYLNAVLRKFSELKPKLPQGTDTSSLSIKYSYPASFVAELRATYGLEASIKILETGNKPAVIMARLRNTIEMPPDWKIFIDKPFKMAIIPEGEMAKAADSAHYYIQNVTPAYLIGNLCDQVQKTPKRILDMCASPGGKSLAISDFFPSANLFANDISSEKTQKLKENFEKYNVKASISCSDGQVVNFDEKFDLIIIDAPCSNSGVLNKRPEARWRLDEEHYRQLESIQFNLLKNAKFLLNPEGEIWYMTCSILPRENEDMAEKACRELSLQVKGSMKVLPNEEGWDGGYACCLKPV